MALSGSFKTSGYGPSSKGDYIYVKFSWTATQSITGNYSDVAWKIAGDRAESGYATSGGFRVKINGETVLSTTKRVDMYNGTVIATGTQRIYHDDAGSASFSASVEAGIFWNWSLSGDAQYSGSGSFTLDTIARASVPTVSIDPATIGSPLTIYTNRKSAAFTHSLHYKLNGTWHDIAYGVGTSFPWTPPISLAESITDRSKWEDFGIMCRTRNGDTIVGDKWVYIDLLVPENEGTKPTVTAVVSPNNTDWLLSTNAKYEDFEGLYIQGMSKVDVTISADGKLGTDIGSYATTVEGKSYSNASFTSDTLTSFGALSIKAKATDNRGISNTDSPQIDVIAYSKPLVKPINGKNAVVCSRCDEEGNLTSSGTNLKIAAKRSFSPVLVDGIPLNTCTLYCAVKEHTATDYGSWITLISGSVSNNDYNSIVPGVVLDTNKMYDVCIAVRDDLGNWDTSVVVTIPTEETPLDLAEGGLNVGIGRRAKKNASRSFDCGWDAYFEKGIYLGETHISEEQLVQLLKLIS